MVIPCFFINLYIHIFILRHFQQKRFKYNICCIREILSADFEIKFARTYKPHKPHLRDFVRIKIIETSFLTSFINRSFLPYPKKNYHLLYPKSLEFTSLARTCTNLIAFVRKRTKVHI